MISKQPCTNQVPLLEGANVSPVGEGKGSQKQTKLDYISDTLKLSGMRGKIPTTE